MDNIRFTDDRDKEKIISLWSSVFKDSREDILFFLNNCKNYRCLAYFDGDTLASMLFMIDCRYCKANGKYVYAVATDKEHRLKGYSKSLLTYSKRYAENGFLWLIPANTELIAFYEKQDFEIKLYSDKNYENKVSFNESSDIIEYLYDGCELEQPVGMIYSKADFPKGNIK